MKKLLTGLSILLGSAALTAHEYVCTITTPDEFTCVEVGIGPEPDPTPDPSFKQKCNQPGVLVCEGFETQADIDARFVGREWTKDAVLDTEIGGAKLFVPSNTPADTSGSLRFAFDAVSREEPGEQHIWVQYRVRHQSDFLEQDFGTDPKVSILYGGSSSCSDREFTVNRRDNHINTYTNCGGSGGVGQRGGDTTCLYRNENPRQCLLFRGEDWATHTFKINLDTYHVDMWVKYDEDPHLVHTIDATMTNQSSVMSYNNFMLTAYMTGKSANLAHPEYELWYDDVIISREPIELPVGASVYPDMSGKDSTVSALVDFGPTEAENVYETEFRESFKDRYQRYSTANGAINGGVTSGSNAGYNRAGVQGSTRTFNPGDEILVTVYNDSEETVSTKDMLLSFSHSDRRANHDETWYVFDETMEIYPGESAVVRFTVSHLSTGTYSFANVARNPRGSLIDLIEHRRYEQ